MHYNLNQQISRCEAGISVNTCVSSDEYIFYDKRRRHVYFSVTMFNLTINVNINTYCDNVTQKKTNLSCICQKSELNNQEIDVFRCFGGISVIRRTKFFPI